MTYFSDLGLAEPILRALGAKGYSDPTPIQHQAIPALLEGRDLLGIAQTGTGKTAAFSLPSLHRLIANPMPRKPAACRMLVLSPTRELAAQIADNMRGYARYLSLSIQCVFGGTPVGKQARALVPGCDILVATPGRLLDLIDQRALTLRNVEIFVLDEADQMMDLGFIQPLKRIAGLLPRERQSLFFSATMPNAIAELGRQFIHDPVKVEVTPPSTTAERIDQYATFVDQKEKQALLTLRLREIIASGALDRALVFTRTKHGADRVARHLVAAGIEAAAIHGNKSQAQRTAALKGFRAGTVRVLVATDIAARGIDVSGVSHVFNFELPNVAEQYVHRIGRTARAGAEGTAMSFVAPDERAFLRDIERLTRVRLTPTPLPDNFAQEAKRLPLPSKKAMEEAEQDSPPARAQRKGGRPQRSERPQRDERPRREEHQRREERQHRAERPRRYESAPKSSFDPLAVDAGPREARPGEVLPKRMRKAHPNESAPEQRGRPDDNRQRPQHQPRTKDAAPHDNGPRNGPARHNRFPGKPHHGQSADGATGPHKARRRGPHGRGRPQGQRANGAHPN